MNVALRHDSEALKQALGQLTPREREVLILIAQGLTILRIAELLNRSVKTVETHRLSLGRKLGVNNRVELTRLAIQGGLITLPGVASLDQPGVQEELRIEAAKGGAAGDIVRALDAATAATTGESFFRSLIEHLGPALTAQVAFVGEYADGNAHQIQVIAIWARHRVIEPFRFTVASTMCCGLDDRSVSYEPSGLRKKPVLPPALRELDIDCCMGTALHDVDGKRLGVLMVLSDAALDPVREPELILRIFASRAGAELQRLQAESRLRESEQRYRLLAEHSTDMISRHTPEGVYTYASPACRNLLGYEPEDLVGHSAYEFFHPDDVEAIQTSHHNILSRPIMWTVEYRLRKADHAYTWLETSCTAIRDPATEQVVELIAVTRDISRRRAVQAELEEAHRRTEARVRERTRQLEDALESIRGSDDRFRTVVDQANDGIFLAEASGRIVEVNHRGAAMLGYVREEVLRLGLTDLVAPHEHAGLAELSERHRRGERVLRDWQMRAKSGEVVRLELVTQQLTNGTLLAVARDTSVLRQAEKDLLRARQRYETLATLSPIGLWSADALGNCTYANQRWCEIAGMSAEESLGLGWAKSVYPEDRDRLVREWQDAVRERHPFQSHGRLQRPDGAITWILSNARPEFEADGTLKGFIGTTADITAIKNAQSAIEYSERKYRALVEAAGAGMAEVDDVGRVVEANDQYVRLTGHQSLDEIRGRSVVEWTADHDKERNDQAVRACAKAGFIRGLLIDYVWPDGTFMPIEISATVIKGPDGVRMVSVCRESAGRSGSGQRD